MRIFNGASRRERQRRLAVAAGELIDVTRDARLLGLHEKVFISNRLWKSLVQPFPFAQPDDYLPLTRLLSLLKAHLRTSQSPQSNAFLVPRTQLPEWFRGPCYLKLLIDSQDGRYQSVVVQPFSDPFPISKRRLEESLPASLLVRLAETLQCLMLVSRTVEQGLVESMRGIVTQFIQANPFRLDIDAHLAAVPPENSLPFPPDDFRFLLLSDLDELLAILAKYSDPKSTQQIEALKSCYRAVRSPLAAFSQILEDLLRFAASCANVQAPMQSQAFAHLLRVYANVSVRLQRLETEVPCDDLALVRFHIRLLAQTVATPHVQFLSDLGRACAQLINNRGSYSTHGLAHEYRSTVVWH